VIDELAHLAQLRDRRVELGVDVGERLARQRL
jgi:hypothetical protein